MKKPYSDWIDKARDDLKAARILLSNDDYPPHIVCFLGQQSAEKYFKAFLTYKSIEIPYTHDLFLLAEKYLIPLDSTFESLREHISILNEYSVKPRYPDFLEEYTKPDAEEEFNTAKEIAEFIMKKIIA